MPKINELPKKDEYYPKNKNTKTTRKFQIYENFQEILKI